jgi:hypothetical protein
MRIPALAALLVLLPAAPAAAAGPWSAPQTLSSAHEFVEPVGVAFAGDGSALADWTWQDGTDASARTGADGAGRPAGAAAFAPQRTFVAPRKVSRAPWLAGVATFGAGRALRVTVVRHRLNPLRADAFAVRAAAGTTAGRFGADRTVATGPQMLRVTLGANSRGDAAVAWWERTNRFSRLFVAVRRAGHAFGRPVRLAGRGFGDVAVAVSSRGAVLVAWESGGTIRTRTRAAHGRGFGRALPASSSPAPDAAVEAGISRSGRAVVAWAAQRRTEGGTTGPITYAAAIRRSGGRRFGEQVLEREPSSRLAQPVRLAMEPSGRATVAWAGFDGTSTRVRVSTADAGAPFGAPQDVSPPGAAATLGDLAAGHGRRVLVWIEGTADDGSGRLQAAFASGLLFGASETVTDGPAARIPRAAIDPASGRPTVVWSERPPGVTGTVARAATRAG